MKQVVKLEAEFSASPASFMTTTHSEYYIPHPCLSIMPKSRRQIRHILRHHELLFVSLESGEMCERYKVKVTLIARMGGNGMAHCLITSDMKAWW